VFQVISRETGEVRIWVRTTADTESCQGVLQTLLPPGATLYSDELAGYQGWPSHLTVYHSPDEWARDDDGDGAREVHCNTSEGAHTGLRPFLCTFRGVHKAYLACYLAIYEAIRNAKRITPEIVQRLCFGSTLYTGCT
jgi:transposase-like protein